MSNELERTWKEVVMALAFTCKDLVKPRKSTIGMQVSRPRFEPCISQSLA
jgi:hypothetical protein